MKLYFALVFLVCFIPCLFVAGQDSGERDDLKKKKIPGFIFTIPKTLTQGKNQTVCISLHESNLPAKTIVDLRWKQKHIYTTRSLDTEHSCFELGVPLQKIKEPQFVSVRVQVQLNGTIYTAHNQDPILLYPYKKRTFIDTDRGFYKPGDRIRFRILVLNEEFLPAKSYKIPEIKIKNPFDITVAVWENVTTDLGLAQLEHQMVHESIIGKWKIEAIDEVKTFEVHRYVLPRFKVEIIYPKIIYHELKTVELKVCAFYSYGKNVRGNAFIKLIDSHQNMKPIHRTKEVKDGCAEFTLTNADLNLSNIAEKFPLYDPRIILHITATVTEYGTSKIDISMVKSLITLKPYSLHFVNEPTFQPGLPYKGKIDLKNINIDVTKEVIEICYNFAIKKSWNYLNNEQCSNFSVHNNSVEFSILPMKSNVIHLHLNARSLNHTNVGDSFLAVRLFSPTTSYIFIETNNHNKEECNYHQNFNVIFTTEKMVEKQNVTFYYMLKLRGHIYKLKKIIHSVHKQSLEEVERTVGEAHKFVKYGTSVDKFNLRFKLEGQVLSRYDLLVYYVTSYGEIVAASRKIEIEPCLVNKVDAQWSEKHFLPGDKATLHLKTSSDSLCSISSVDKSTEFLRSTHHLLDTKSVLKPFVDENETAPSARKTCNNPTKKNSQAAPLIYNDEIGNNIWDLKRRRKRHVYSFSEDLDALDTFNAFGVTIISNLKVVTKICYTGPIARDNIHQAQFLTDQYENENDEANLPLRSYFPETWLWELVPVKGHIYTQIQRQLPHTITKWITDVLCVSDTESVGFANVNEITTFQPFFIDVSTPYSIKRNEILYLHVNIFNYLNYSLPIRITLDQSKGLDLANPLGKRSESNCVPFNNTVTHMFLLRGTDIGTVNVTVSAEVDSSYPKFCGPEAVVNKRDAILKQIIVEPEGYPMKQSKSALLCTSEKNNTNNVTWELTVPSDVVPGTEKAYVVINGDLLGPTIENLEDLLDMPTGCGEQIMASMAPNLYILRYLNATNSLRPSVRQKIIKNLKIGYQRILNYVHKDGSFSAFGYHDPAGSMFLTAFVVRTLQEARQHIYVDERVINKAVQWILEHQLENGCFNTMLHVFQDMGGTSTENSTAGLTAYVMISLIEANIDVPKSVQTNAKYCIRSQHNPDKYTLAISCYALFKLKWYSEAYRMLKRLMDNSNQQQQMMWWSNKDESGSLASDIEITSYLLLSLLHYNTTENLAHAHSVVRWLSSNRGAHGGFKSTQDTAVALYALTRYASIITSRDLDLEVTLGATAQKQIVRINSNEALKSKRFILKEARNIVNLRVEGQGCVMVQVVVQYYLKHLPKSEAFKLALDIEPVSTIDQCSIASLSSCLAYTGPDLQSNMVVMEVTLPSGYQADRASLYKLVESETFSKVKMFEEIKNQVVLYFTKLDKQLICVNFNINENSYVAARAESLIKIYDYYKPEYETFQYFRMSNECSQNETLLMPSLLNATFDIQNNTHGANPSTEDENKILKKRMVLYPITENKNKGKSTNYGNEMNPKFVNVDVDMDIPEGVEGNVPIYTKLIFGHSNSQTSRKIIKRKIMSQRNTTTGLNPQFVDMDVDMQMPGGMDGNNPTYVRPKYQDSSLRNKYKNKTLRQRRTIYHENLSSENYINNYGKKTNSIKKKLWNKEKLRGGKDLNPDFVDVNYELQVPSGMEGTYPVYLKPSNFNETSRDL